MTKEERLELLKQIEKDIHVCSLESTFLDDAKSCAIRSVIEELEQEPTTDYRRAFMIACELLNGSILYGVDSDKIFEIMLEEDDVVTSNSYAKYILNHLQELDQGQYAIKDEAE